MHTTICSKLHNLTTDKPSKTSQQFNKCDHLNAANQSNLSFYFYFFYFFYITLLSKIIPEKSIKSPKSKEGGNSYSWVDVQLQLCYEL